MFETFSGMLEHAPMIKACRLAAECRLLGTQEFPKEKDYFGEVASVCAGERALEDGAPDRERVAEARSVGKKYRA